MSQNRQGRPCSSTTSHLPLLPYTAGNKHPGLEEWPQWMIKCTHRFSPLLLLLLFIYSLLVYTMIIIYEGVAKRMGVRGGVRRRRRPRWETRDSGTDSLTSLWVVPWTGRNTTETVEKESNDLQGEIDRLNKKKSVCCHQTQNYMGAKSFSGDEYFFYQMGSYASKRDCRIEEGSCPGEAKK